MIRLIHEQTYSMKVEQYVAALGASFDNFIVAQLLVLLTRQLLPCLLPSQSLVAKSRNNEADLQARCVPRLRQSEMTLGSNSNSKWKMHEDTIR